MNNLMKNNSFIDKYHCLGGLKMALVNIHFVQFLIDGV